MKKVIFWVLLIVVSTIASSCEKVEDEESDTEDLRNAYIISAKIINVSPYNWDNGSSPDLQIKLAKSGSADWTYISDKIDDVEQVPVVLTFADEINITNEDWELELIDYDDLNSNDVIYRIAFNPFENASSGIIPIYSNGLLVLEFNYVIK